MQNGDGEGRDSEDKGGDRAEGGDRSGRSEPDSRGGRAAPQAERRRSFHNADELLLEEVKSRAMRGSARLKECIMGTLMIELTNGKRYGFDCRQPEILVAPLAGDLGAHAPPDCSIRLSEDNLMRIASGDLNPQVGMLSDKIRVRGKSSIAVYFFNLIAPRPG